MSDTEQHWSDRLRVGIPRDLREIRRLYASLGDEALHRADDSSDIPGGDAMHLMGPAANLEAWGHRYMRAEDEGMTTDTNYAYDQVDSDTHPLLILATWEDAVREERDQPTDLRATVERASEYLLGALDWMLSDDEYGSARFLAVTELAADLRKIRARLESVLHDGIRPDRGVPCMTCGTDLVKVWGEDEDADRWRCRPCDTWSTHEQYMQAVRADYLREADRLTATDMEAAHRIRPGTLRVWAHRGDVHKRGKDDSGRTLYDVAEAVSCRDRDARALPV